MSSAAAFEPDVVVVGAGLAGLVATHELVRAGRRVLVVDQENRNNLGAQAFWSLGGLFLVDSPEQRRLGIKDSYDLARQDWLGSAGFDREDEDRWPRQWAEAYLRFATAEKRQYLHELGLRFTPVVGWAERGGHDASGHGNSVPRFHLAWGSGPEVVRIFAEPVLAGRAATAWSPSRSVTGWTRSWSRTAPPSASAAGRCPTPMPTAVSSEAWRPPGTRPGTSSSGPAACSSPPAASATTMS